MKLPHRPRKGSLAHLITSRHLVEDPKDQLSFHSVINLFSIWKFTNRPTNMHDPCKENKPIHDRDIISLKGKMAKSSCKLPRTLLNDEFGRVDLRSKASRTMPCYGTILYTSTGVLAWSPLNLCMMTVFKAKPQLKTSNKVSSKTLFSNMEKSKSRYCFSYDEKHKDVY